MCGQKMKKHRNPQGGSICLCICSFWSNVCIIYNKDNAFIHIGKKAANRYCDNHYSRLAWLWHQGQRRRRPSSQSAIPGPSKCQKLWGQVNSVWFHQMFVFFLFSIFFRCFFALWRLRGRCQHPVYKGSHEDDCACTTSCEALALESANVEIQRRLNSAASTMTDTVHFQRSNTSCHKSDVLLWHCRQPQRRMSARKMQLRLARLFEFWNQRVFLQRNVFACFCGNWRIPIFLFAYVIIPTQ